MLIKSVDLNLKDFQQISCVCPQKGNVDLCDCKVTLSEPSGEVNSEILLNRNDRRTNDYIY